MAQCNVCSVETLFARLVERQMSKSCSVCMAWALATSILVHRLAAAFLVCSGRSRLEGQDRCTGSANSAFLLLKLCEVASAIPGCSRFARELWSAHATVLLTCFDPWCLCLSSVAGRVGVSIGVDCGRFDFGSPRIAQNMCRPRTS